MTTSIIYPYYAAAADGDELRLSLRSLADNLQGDYEPIIVGDVPDWYTGKALAMPRITQAEYRNQTDQRFHEKWHPYIDVLWKLAAAACAEDISETFVVLWDETYIMKPIDVEYFLTPRYRGDIPEKPFRPNDFNDALTRSRKRLEKRGLPINDFSSHHPFPLCKSDLPDYFQEFDPLVSPSLIETQYHNWRKTECSQHTKADFQYANSCKCSDSKIPNARIINFGKVTTEIEADLSERFSELSPWEKADAVVEPTAIPTATESTTVEIESEPIVVKTKPSLSICIPLQTDETMPLRQRNFRVIANELSTLAKERGDIEIVVAEWGGTIADGYEHIRRVEGVGDFNRSRARNQAYAAATSDLVCFCDTDMILPPEAWDKAIEEAKQYDCYSPHRQYWRANPEVTEQQTDGDRWRWDVSIRKLDSSRKPGRFVFAGGMIFCRRSAVERIGHWDEGFEGWGKEDNAFEKMARACKLRLGYGRYARPVHLYHEPATWGPKQASAHWRRNYVKNFGKTYERRSRSVLLEAFAAPSTPTISVVLNAFARPDTLNPQITAIKKQSVSPSEILVWKNQSDMQFNAEDFSDTVYAHCSSNMGVWSRFAFALNAKSDFVCVFDDDTIPGENWFKNCLDTISKVNGLLGAVGVKFSNSRSYESIERTGWPNPSNEIKQCDIVGHAWFFRREWLADFWSELPDANHSPIAGEDFHFSYRLQQRGVKTYTPPHPADDTTLWGSLHGVQFGNDQVAISNTYSGSAAISNSLPIYVKKGFRLMCDDAIA